MEKPPFMRLAWQSDPNKGETIEADQVQITGRSLAAYHRNGDMTYTNAPDLLIQIATDD